MAREKIKNNHSDEPNSGRSRTLNNNTKRHKETPTGVDLVSHNAAKGERSLEGIGASSSEPVANGRKVYQLNRGKNTGWGVLIDIGIGTKSEWDALVAKFDKLDRQKIEIANKLEELKTINLDNLGEKDQGNLQMEIQATEKLIDEIEDYQSSQVTEPVKYQNRKIVADTIESKINELNNKLKSLTLLKSNLDEQPITKKSEVEEGAVIEENNKTEPIPKLKLSRDEFTDLVKKEDIFLGRNYKEVEEELIRKYDLSGIPDAISRLHANWKDYKINAAAKLKTITIEEIKEIDKIEEVTRPNNYRFNQLTNTGLSDDQEKDVKERIKAYNDGENRWNLHRGVGGVLTMDLTGPNWPGGRRGDARLQFLPSGSLTVVNHQNKPL